MQSASCHAMVLRTAGASDQDSGFQRTLTRGSGVPMQADARRFFFRSSLGPQQMTAPGSATSAFPCRPPKADGPLPASGNDRTAESGRSFRVVAYVPFRPNLMLGTSKPPSQWVSTGLEGQSEERQETL